MTVIYVAAVTRRSARNVRITAGIAINPSVQAVATPARSVSPLLAVAVWTVALDVAVLFVPIAEPITFAEIAMKTKSIPRKLPKVLQPTLRFTPTAWAKLLVLRDLGPTEIGGFGIAQTSDLLLVSDVQLVEQDSSCVSVAFDDLAVAEFFDQQVDQGLKPAQFARIWVHTHPGHCPLPSWIDEETFERVFGQTDWAVMFILARGGQTYCRLEHHTSPAVSLELAVEVDYAARSLPATRRPGKRSIWPMFTNSSRWRTTAIRSALIDAKSLAQPMTLILSQGL